MTVGCVSTFPRRIAPELCKFIRPTERGRRECRVLAAPAVSCASSAKETHTSIQVQPRHSGIPCAVVLRLIPRSPWRRIPLASIAAGLKACRTRLGSTHLRQLDTSHGCQDHTALPYASAPYVLRAVSAHGRRAALRTTSRANAAASTASRPTFVTMANAPLVGTGRRELYG
jgi:hypothetical protein